MQFKEKSNFKKVTLKQQMNALGLITESKHYNI